MPHLALAEVREQLGETPGVGVQIVHPGAAEGALPGEFGEIFQ